MELYLVGCLFVSWETLHKTRNMIIEKLGDDDL